MERNGSTLGRRVVGSARGLAKVQTLQEGGRQRHFEDWPRRPRHAGISSGQNDSFRSSPDLESSRSTEQEFNSFFQGSALDLDHASGLQTAVSCFDRDGDEDIPNTYCRAESWHMTWDHALGVANQSDEAESRTVLQESMELCEGHSSLKAAAIARIDQVQRHLRRAAMDQCKGQVVSPSLHVNSQRSIDGHGTPAFDRQSRTTLPFHAQRSITSKRAEQLLPDFRCKHRQCHENLKALLSPMSTAFQRLHCIHIGCERFFDSAESWEQHLVLPHHLISSPGNNIISGLNRRYSLSRS
ncbi:hypothetical protein EJ03DRAFT_183154 [Teratosphaeria nubilosa]|uniref:C2H2-type domain-containing protein n=1 Tax=Teratosphaeria nubilosa TaxID=161662 RepID=A0A6G1L105_9PEZI|nr:hypothetical protein EJ03DRAFT_183154 [Teratosphaeria nubilosa]